LLDDGGYVASGELLAVARTSEKGNQRENQHDAEFHHFMEYQNLNPAAI
jgi:hypothetical protein